MTFHRYSQELLGVVNSHPLVANVSLAFREIDEYEGHVEGRLELVGGYQLYISEYVFATLPPRRSKYRFHVQDAFGKFICRWDNAPHHPHIETFPDHCHVAGKDVQPSPPMDIPNVLAALTKMLI